MKAYLTRRYLFSSSHRLHSAEMRLGETPTPMASVTILMGMATTMRWKLRSAVTRGRSTGMVCNLMDLDGFVRKEILDRFHLKNLNILDEFADAVPTTENLCMVIYDILQRGFLQAHLERVRIEETMSGIRLNMRAERKFCVTLRGTQPQRMEIPGT